MSYEVSSDKSLWSGIAVAGKNAFNRAKFHHKQKIDNSLSAIERATIKFQEENNRIRKYKGWKLNGL